ncbi:hypothetical protein Adt_41637 [Abeliophyllum distichum]|uniref:Uncharacterized protein n=1 Tax=Abeliophyllum distichum TaxID=126358 RepID=A0ABD1PPD9_9LAMI
MTAGGEQLVERIGEVHPEWDLSFLRHLPGEASTFTESPASGEAPAISEALGTLPNEFIEVLYIFRTRSQCPDDQVCSNCIPDPWKISLVGLNGGYLEDPDSDDEARNYPQLVLTMSGRLLLSLVMILQKEETVLGGMHPSNLGGSL